MMRISRHVKTVQRVKEEISLMLLSHLLLCGVYLEHYNVFNLLNLKWTLSSKCVHHFDVIIGVSFRHKPAILLKSKYTYSVKQEVIQRGLFKFRLLACAAPNSFCLKRKWMSAHYHLLNIFWQAELSS